MINYKSYISRYLEFIKKAFPVSRQGSFVGLDVGTHICKVVEITQRQGVYHLLRWGIHPLENMDEKTIITGIVNTWDLKAESRVTVGAVSGRGTLIRYVDMPATTFSALKRALYLEAEKFFPFPKDTTYMDCAILNQSADGQKMSVLLAGVKKEVVDSRIKLLKDCGLIVSDVTMGAMALMNVYKTFFNHASVSNEEAVALVDINEWGTSLVVMVGDAPRFNRDIFIGTQEIFKRLVMSGDLSALDARKYLNDPSDRKEQVEKEVVEVMGSLSSELKLSFDYFANEKKVKIGRLLVCGEASHLPGVEGALKEKLNVEVSLWNPFLSESLVVDGAIEELGQKSSRLITALGLALNEYA